MMSGTQKPTSSKGIQPHALRGYTRTLLYEYDRIQFLTILIDGERLDGSDGPFPGRQVVMYISHDDLFFVVPAFSTRHRLFLSNYLLLV